MPKPPNTISDCSVKVLKLLFFSEVFISSCSFPTLSHPHPHRHLTSPTQIPKVPAAPKPCSWRSRACHFPQASLQDCRPPGALSPGCTSEHRISSIRKEETSMPFIHATNIYLLLTDRAPGMVIDIGDTVQNDMDLPCPGEDR